MNGLDPNRPAGAPPPSTSPGATRSSGAAADAFAAALDGARRAPGADACRGGGGGDGIGAEEHRDAAVDAARRPRAAGGAGERPRSVAGELDEDAAAREDPSSAPSGVVRPDAIVARHGGVAAADSEEREARASGAIGAAVGGAAVAAVAAPAGPATGSPSGTGATAPALEVAAIGSLMGELHAIDASAPGQWRFALAGNALGLDSLVLSRTDAGVWNLRFGSERARAPGARTEIESLRETLRERGHRVGDIVVAGGDAGEATA